MITIEGQYRQIFQLWLITISLFAISCTAKDSYRVESYREIKFEDLADDISIPAKAWDLLEGKVSDHGKGAESDHSSEATTAAGASKEFVFSEIIVFLAEKNSGVLKSKAFKISLPRGGGEINLANYIGITPGSFFVGFEFPEFVDATEKKVLYVSQARKRRLDNVIYGAGCNQFFDITNKYFEAMKGEGLKVNTTRERHLSVLGGHFLFSATKNGTVYVSQVTFKDSNHLNLFCGEH